MKEPDSYIIPITSGAVIETANDPEAAIVACGLTEEEAAEIRVMYLARDVATRDFDEANGAVEKLQAAPSRKNWTPSVRSGDLSWTQPAN